MTQEHIPRSSVHKPHEEWTCSQGHDISSRLTMYKPSSRLLPAAVPLTGQPGEVILETARILVRRFVLTDGPVITKAINHESVAANLRDHLPFPFQLSDAEEFLARHCVPSEHGYPARVAVLAKPADGSEPVYIGSLIIKPGDDINYRTWELGYWFDPAYWGKGYGTEAVIAFSRWVFTAFPKLLRLEAFAFADNAASMRVLEKAGFVCEGFSKQRIEKNGVLLDEATYGLLRSDVETVAE